MSDPSTNTGYAHASRRRRPSQHTGDDRTQAILSAAERLLAQRPLADFSVDDLARGAGISRPTFYFYFPSKNAVVLSLLDQLHSTAHAAMNTLRTNLTGDPETLWRDRIEAFFEVSGSHRAVAVAGAAAKATNPEVRQAWATLMQQWISFTAVAISAERSRGAAPHTVPAADLSIALNMLSERVMAATFTAEEPAIHEDRVIDTLVHIWLASIYPSSRSRSARATVSSISRSEGPR
ncbi:TetR/AcrR family transcriptional regulator [Mycobacterium sherrisii]|uniref:TetR family transcriptional regulator n=1 Tax=Mycobacterium sherrisii TaxID=243061 RepID=A0A1E3SN53_9MYCO|nr:TetR/AcrR family transcriptional regulator [Mycobacterium sherrisii]MCV7028517.1 TetR/AcrR family transcriptional regulator [Mycobacterium sherrisii]MEC4764874.1 TetR/AcrR family transcriptional regulator [Mycobacterium sherrisii]ODR03577.1 TetR family transcriptional regulator [Mycobacterium sherrisii]ORW82975.1 TetR family transcriptional regulator [Mycobacterium sherrisii]